MIYQSKSAQPPGMLSFPPSSLQFTVITGYVEGICHVHAEKRIPSTTSHPQLKLNNFKLHNWAMLIRAGAEGTKRI